MLWNCDTNIDDILEKISCLSKSELERVAGRVYNILNGDGTDNSAHSLCRNTDISVCKKCGSVHIVKRGKNAKGYQKYWCKDCGGIFTATSTTVFSYSHKSADIWKEFIFLTLEGRTLRYCAVKCSISLPTSLSHSHIM